MLEIMAAFAREGATDRQRAHLPPWLGRAREFIDERSFGSFSLRDVARAAGATRSTWHASFAASSAHLWAATFGACALMKPRDCLNPAAPHDHRNRALLRLQQPRAPVPRVQAALRSEPVPLSPHDDLTHLIAIVARAVWRGRRHARFTSCRERR